MEKDFEDIILLITEKLLQNQLIQEPILYEYGNYITKYVSEDITDELPNSFYKMSCYLENYWRSGSFENVSSSYVFIMGRLFAMTNILIVKLERTRSEEDIKKYAEELKDKYRLFKYIKEKPGVTHNELVKLISISKSSLSQFIAKIQRYDFLIFRRSGREKRYYLSKKGERLYAIMKENKMHNWKNSFLSGIEKDKLYGDYSAVYLNRTVFKDRNIDESPFKLNKKEKYGDLFDGIFVFMDSENSNEDPYNFLSNKERKYNYAEGDYEGKYQRYRCNYKIIGNSEGRTIKYLCDNV